MALTESQRQWYFHQIQSLDKGQKIVTLNQADNLLIFDSSIRCDESKTRQIKDEELVRALALCMLVSNDYKYSKGSFYIEKYYQHGHPSSKHDEVDLIIFDSDDLPFAMWEFKSPDEYEKNADEYIKYQLFGTAPLVGMPKLLVYATIMPTGTKPSFTLICIDRGRYNSYESWNKDERPYSKTFPEAYTDPSHEPLKNGGKIDLRLDCTQQDFRAVAATFHTEFFGEHPDNILYTNLVKCLLVKIYDEKQTKKGKAYSFQVFYKDGKEENSASVFQRINDLYKIAYTRYIESNATEPDEISPKEFPPDRVKTVVKSLQGMSLTRGASLHGDVIGAFFEEVLRVGFKQDKGMYFTHDNLVKFMLGAINLDELTVKIWKKSTHPENRLPYIIDPACGSGTFLIRAMHITTNAIRSRKEDIVNDLESTQFFNARMSNSMPNYWAEHFIYGMDPKFVMAITSKVNMVLHGDGSAHIFKYDALKRLLTYDDDKLKPVNPSYRSIPKDRYKFDMSESFDVVTSNPPFGITIASDTKAFLPTSFGMKGSAPSEAFFLERWFQLLKPGGRLGVVVPESLLNTVENADCRLFLYRMFWIRAIVALPRNLFIETPTLTSLLFAQKKTKEEIEIWDKKWDSAFAAVQKIVNNVKILLKSFREKKSSKLDKIQKEIIQTLSPIVSEKTKIIRKGLAPLSVAIPPHITAINEAIRYYNNLINIAGFKILIRNHIFSEVCKAVGYEYPVYLVEEVGYKLSKRKERIRPNQLCKFLSEEDSQELPNLHLAKDPIKLIINIKDPERVLDFIRRDVKWT